MECSNVYLQKCVGESVLIIGKTPPPIGGVSIHIERSINYFNKKNIRVELSDPRNVSSKLIRIINLFTKLLIGKYDNVIIHEFSVYKILLIHILSRIRKFHFLYIDHNWRRAEKLSLIEKKITAYNLNHVASVVFMGNKISEYYKKNGIGINRKIIEDSPFLPPFHEDAENILDSYSAETKRFIRVKTPLLLANAHRLVFYREADLYGFDMCIDLVHRLKDVYPGLGLIFALAEIGDQEYFHACISKIEKLGLSDNIMLLTDNKEIWPIYRFADVLLRPTITEGFSMSICEAIHFGCKVVASDVSERPCSVILFQNRNPEDFLDKVKCAIETHRTNILTRYKP